ncbi:MAG TPA: hypothetical protein VJV79_04790 [Polyangiaceae bacterium]|nr:hypothetical protein [Polyangiaceae bacterium]
MLEAVTRVPGRQGTVDAIPQVKKAKPWLVGFVLLHFACQLLLLVPSLGSARIIMRTATFGVGLAFLVLIPNKGVWRTPLRACALCILGLLGLEFFHPEGGGLLAGFAALMLNLAILAPIFWVPRTGTTSAQLRALITILWLFYTVSAILGVLQAYFPGRFQPPLSSVLAANSRNQLAGLEIVLASGARMFRPMGLTDVPGGAASAGLYAVLLGTGMLLSPTFRGARFLAVGSMFAGLMCLYLCQVRSLLVMAGVGIIVLLALLLITGRVSKLVGLLGAIGAIIPGAFALALAIGGNAMIRRLTSLIESDPGSVYYTNRGHFLETTLNHHLPLYPLGAGLGRYGMVNSYFGNPGTGLWVEIQWTGWLFDGGVALMFLYTAAILIASAACLKVALGRLGSADPSLSIWASVIVGYNVGAFAICFNYPLFGGTGGVEFWVLNMALLCAAQNAGRGVLRTKLA